MHDLGDRTNRGFMPACLDEHLKKFVIDRTVEHTDIRLCLQEGDDLAKGQGQRFCLVEPAQFALLTTIAKNCWNPLNRSICALADGSGSMTRIRPPLRQMASLIFATDCPALKLSMPI